MDNFQLTTLLSKIRDFETKLDSKDLVGIFFIVIHNWELKNFRPVLILTKDKIILWINDKYIEISRTNINKYSIDDKLATIKLSANNSDFQFSLVSIDKLLIHTNRKYTETFYRVMNLWLERKEIDAKLLQELPNQKSSTTTNMSSTVIIASSLLLLVLGFAVQPFNFTLAWFFLLGGLILGVVGLIYAITKKRS